MSLKQEIETWVLALEHYDNQEYEEAIRIFGQIADTSKIFFNCGVIYATLGEHEKAVQCYQRAVSLDQYLAIAYFQEGVSNFLLGDFEEALANFNDTLLYLRGNTSIDYEQLGLKFRLFSCEVLFNRGLCYIYLQQMGPGMQDLEYAAKEKVTPDHDVIDDAIRERAEGYTVFSIPVGVVYRPNAAKVKNLKTKDYLGKARLIAASSQGNARSGRQPTDSIRTQPAPDDRPAEGISFAATNLVQKNLSGRSRQQSEPPLNRTLFPPTPPPEGDKSITKSPSGGSVGANGRPGSVRAARPPRLNLDGPGSQPNGRGGADMPASDKPRIGTTRTASEPRGPPSRYHQRGLNAQEADKYFPSQDTGGHKRGTSETNASVPRNGYGEDACEVYTSSRSMASSGRRGVPPQQQRYIDEEEEYGGDMGGAHGARGIYESPGSSQRRTRSPIRESRRADSRRPDVHRFRIKVHAFEDTRYIMIGPTLEYSEFEAKIREKFGFRSLLRIRMQDEGDMITMVDQEDLDLLLSSATEAARKEGSEMGKMEETESGLLRKKHRASSALLRWAAGASALANTPTENKSPEQIHDEERARTLRTVRESILWFLRRGLERAAEAQRDMVEKRIERVREKEKSVLYKSEAGGARPVPASVPVSGPGPATADPHLRGSTLSETETAAIEAELSPEQLQLFAEENDLLLRQYEDALSKVQNAEKSLLEISSLQQTLVSHLSTQEEYIEQLVMDASTTTTNIGQGNKELKRATQRRSTAQAVFWGTVGLCTWLVVWDLIF
ncbi:hypothetical protein KXV76_003933 [Aspergillus fumigatus]|nr:hypothetical protein KXV76_003933 [Aspergillus fumigatus]